ncbi:hypothetical protein C7212DRAFT_336182 [Tuber magnatum]|uniref:Uncharacterized protein n=1 Tax=Tuber magnatum TaxID=42249 RepID=A0A317SD25_9PEZI|nr:hypothetical protein C7212DRAFT_336182 [Tuber magnatum]
MVYIVKHALLAVVTPPTSVIISTSTSTATSVTSATTCSTPVVTTIIVMVIVPIPTTPTRTVSIVPR